MKYNDLQVSANKNKKRVGRGIAAGQGKTAGRGTKAKGTMSDKCAAIGTEIAKKAKKSKISAVVFDRNGRQYAGRLKALADAARQEGLEF